MQYNNNNRRRLPQLQQMVVVETALAVEAVVYPHSHLRGRSRSYHGDRCHRRPYRRLLLRLSR